MSALKPCPFCGGTTLYHDEDVYGHETCCHDCGAQTGAEDNHAASDEKWNTRADEARVRREVLDEVRTATHPSVFSWYHSWKLMDEFKAVLDRLAAKETK